MDQTSDFTSPLPPRRVAELPSTPTPLPTPPPETSAPPSSSTATISTPLTKKSSLNRFFPFLAVFAVLLVIFLIVKFLLPALQNKSAETVTLNYWGLWEDSTVLNSLIADFESQNPNIKINYKNNDKTDYRTRLAGRLAKNPDTEEVPDIFRLHSSWLPMFTDNLASVPSATLSKIDFEKDFYNVYKHDLKIGNSYYGIPLMYDGLSLFYNKDLIQQAGVDLPKSWWDLQTAAAKLTVRDDQGKIQVAGVAMGLTDNVDHWSDIVGLLLKQNGADILKNTPENDTSLTDVLSYYVNFRNNYKTWDETLPNSTTLFAQGKLAFYFAPSWRVFNIKELNPNLSFDVTTVPQLPTTKNTSTSADVDLTNIHWASYWFEAVNSKSKHQKEAWKFLEFISSKESLEKLYTAASQVRDFGEIYPRLSLADKLTSNSKIKPFIQVANNAESGYLASRTFDDGLNTELNKYFADAINSLALKNSDNSTIISNLKNGITQLIQKYHLK